MELWAQYRKAKPILKLRTIGLGELVGFDGLGDRADLVDLEKEAVAGFFVDCHLDPLGVGHRQVLE